MYKSWFELYEDDRNAAILTVTRALHPECRNKTQLKKVSRFAGDTFYDTYPRLETLTVSPELLSDHELLTRLDALASLDKALPGLYSFMYESQDHYFTTERLATACGVRKARVKQLLETLEESGFVRLKGAANGIYNVACAGLSKRVEFPIGLNAETIPESLEEKQSSRELIQSNPARIQSNRDRCSTSKIFLKYLTNNVFKEKTNDQYLRTPVLVEQRPRLDYSFKEDVSDSFKEDAASLETPTEESSLKDKIAYIVSLWNWFCQQPDRCNKPFRLPKSLMVTGEVPANSPVLKAIERWISEYEWSDCLAVWEGFIEKAETNTFMKMVPNRDPSKKVWNGVTLGWLFGAYGETPGLQRFDDGAYRIFQEDYEPFTVKPMVDVDDTFRHPFAVTSDEYGAFVGIVDAFAEQFPDLPSINHPSVYVDKDGEFNPEGIEGCFYMRMYRYVQSTGDAAVAKFRTFLIERHQIVMKLDPDADETPLEWLFGRDDDGKLRITKALAGKYDRQFGVVSLSSMKTKVLDVVTAYNAVMLTTGGTLAALPDLFRQKGTITSADTALRHLSVWIANTHEWRMKWKSKLRQIESGKLTSRNFEDFVANHLTK